jgi:hypothetical protein
MDSTTQQNAALVEEAASASKLMLDQAQQLVRRVSLFRTTGFAENRYSDDKQCDSVARFPNAVAA